MESSATTVLLRASSPSPPRRAQMRTSYSGRPWITHLLHLEWLSQINVAHRELNILDLHLTSSRHRASGDVLAPVAECNPPAFREEEPPSETGKCWLKNFAFVHFFSLGLFQTVFFHAENQTAPQEERSNVSIWERKCFRECCGLLDVVHKPERLLSEDFQSKHQIPPHRCGCFTVPKRQHLKENVRTFSHCCDRAFCNQCNSL